MPAAVLRTLYLLHALVLMLPGLAVAGSDGPLTLADALATVSDLHPRVAEERAALSLAEAESRAVAAEDDLRVGISLEGRVIEPNPVAQDQSSADSSAVVYARKRLYDFGYRSDLLSESDAGIEGRRFHYLGAVSQHRLNVMRLFFDVLLADLEFTRDNEAMAVGYVRFDRDRHRNELGQRADIEVLEKEQEYQARRIARHTSEAGMRAARARLALAMNRPGELPGNLVSPELPELEQALPEYETLVEQALQHNTLLQAVRKELEATEWNLKAMRRRHGPVLSGALQARASQRDVGSEDPLQAELVLDIPLYQGDRRSADVARAQASLQQKAAELLQLQYRLRQEVLDTWQAIQTLKARQEQDRVVTEFNRLNFDRSQARYELEMETDFGDALVGQSESALQRARTGYELAYQWARLALLTGQPYAPSLETPALAAGQE